MYRRLKAVKYKFGFQLWQHAFLDEFDMFSKDLRDLFADKELVSLVKEGISPEAAEFLLLMSEEIWRLTGYVR